MQSQPYHHGDPWLPPSPENPPPVATLLLTWISRIVFVGAGEIEKHFTTPKQTKTLIYMSGWWFQPTHFEKYANVKMGSSSPIFGGEHKKYLSCHHLVLFYLGAPRIIGPWKLAILMTLTLLCRFKPFHWREQDGWCNTTHHRDTRFIWTYPWKGSHHQPAAVVVGMVTI